MSCSVADRYSHEDKREKDLPAQGLTSFPFSVFPVLIEKIGLE